MSLLSKTPLQEAFAALRADLVRPDGPQISTMRNYRFAILPYPPSEELALRAEVQRLSHDLVAHGWVVVSISLHKLLMDRIRAIGAEDIEWIIECERDFYQYDLARSTSFVREILAPMIEGPDGLAADCARIIQEHVRQRPDRADRTVALIGRAGSLYPFFRTSGLLRHLDGQTGNVPVVLLYPGERRGLTGLSFMSKLPPDHDYRPRIYP